MKKLIGIALVSAVVASAAVAFAAPRHPNIVAAQGDLAKAWDKVLAAQKANEWDLGGHAQKGQGHDRYGQQGTQAGGRSGQRQVTRSTDAAWPPPGWLRGGFRPRDILCVA